MHLAERLHNTCVSLAQSVEFDDFSFFVRESLQKAVWSTVEGKYQQKVKRIPENLRGLYDDFDGLVIHWDYQSLLVPATPVVGFCNVFPFILLGFNEPHFVKPGGSYEESFWDDTLPAARQAEYAQYFIWDQLRHRTYTLWREVEGQAQLAFFLGNDRLHQLPFSPVQYLETGLALGFVELWQLLFIPEAEQADYAEAIGTVVGHVQELFPAAVPLIPAHVMARFPVPALPEGPDYRQLFAAALARLQALPTVRILTSDPLPPGLTLGVRERLRRELGRPVPPALLAFYNQCNGCHLRWRWAGGTSANARGGALHFWPLERVFGGENANGRKQWDDGINDHVLWEPEYFEDMPEVRPMRPFEEPNNVELPCITLASGELKIFLLTGDDADALLPLPVDFTTYLTTAFACAGVDYWQYLLTGEEYDVKKQVQRDMRRLGVNPAQLF